MCEFSNYPIFFHSGIHTYSKTERHSTKSKALIYLLLIYALRTGKWVVFCIEYYSEYSSYDLYDITMEYITKISYNFTYNIEYYSYNYQSFSIFNKTVQYLKILQR